MSSVFFRVALAHVLLGCQVSPTDGDYIDAAVDSGSRDVSPVCRYPQEWSRFLSTALSTGSLLRLYENDHFQSLLGFIITKMYNRTKVHAGLMYGFAAGLRAPGVLLECQSSMKGSEGFRRRVAETKPLYTPPIGP